MFPIQSQLLGSPTLQKQQLDRRNIHLKEHMDERRLLRVSEICSEVWEGFVLDDEYDTLNSYYHEWKEL